MPENHQISDETRHDKPSPASRIAAAGGPNPLVIFRLAWVVFLVLATSAPYLLNFLRTPAGYQYTWIIPPYPEDSFGYMAWAEQAAHGSLLFKLKFTALPHAAFLFNPFFLVVGWLSWLMGGNVGFTLFVVKGVGVVCFLYAFYRYTDYLGLNPFQSVVASVLVGISSGMGGLLTWFDPAGHLTLISGDLSIVDMNTFWSLLWNPLFPYSLTLMLLVLFRLDRGSREGRNADFWIGGAATGILALIHPYSQPLLFALAVLIIVVRKKWAALTCLLRYFLAASPFLIYLGLVAAFNPLIARHDYTGRMSRPSLLAWALGFGLPLLFCGMGLAVGRAQFMKRWWPVCLWFVLSVGLTCLPFWFQRKLILGAHVPLCIMAAVSLDLLLNRFSNFRIRAWLTVTAAVVFLPLLVATPVCLLAGENKEVRNNTTGAYYVSHDLMAGLQFLKTQTRPDDVVFASYQTSRLIPGFSGNTVVSGHWAQSVDAQERRQWMASLFNPQANWMDPGRARKFWGTDIQYIFADDLFKYSLELDPRPWQVILDESDLVFTNNAVLIYKHRSR
jgi:hypothetical protein